MDPVGHPLLGSAVELAESASLVLTGRISLSAHSWLADHAIGEAVFLPGTALVDIALAAGSRVDCPTVAELVIVAPLPLPGRADVQLQVTVGGRIVQASGRWPFTPGTPAATRGPVTCAACSTEDSGHGAVAADMQAGTWPPAGAVREDITGLYSELAQAGYQYGPAFCGLRAVWRLGSDIYAEACLPDGRAADRGFGVHPALLDAVLHAVIGRALASSEHPAGNEIRLPFSWNGVRLRAAHGSVVRARISPVSKDTVEVVATDASGSAAVLIDRLTFRRVNVAQLSAAAKAAGSSAGGELLTMDWVPVSPRGDAGAGRWAVVGADPLGVAGLLDADSYPDLTELATRLANGAPVPAAVVVTAAPGSGNVPAMVRELCAAVLGVLRQWLSAGPLGGARLVIVTRGAVSSVPEDAAAAGAAGLPGAAVWGLVRSAQAEGPGRFVLIDTDGTPESATVLSAAIASGEPQIALRGGRALVPRLGRLSRDPVPRSAADGTGVSLADGLVLVTGGTGTLGGLVARHLVSVHGVRELVLASRRGPGAPGAGRLAADLAGLGAVVRVVACDVASRDAAAGLLYRAGHGLVGVVHCAGALDDAVIGSLTEQRLVSVLASKADAAWHLHELTAGKDLAMFAVFSSAAGVLGSPGQGNYAAANAFLDALACRRRADGLPGVSLAWGLWEQASGMTGHLDQRDLARLRRVGLAPLSSARGLELFDAGLAGSAPAVVAARIDIAALAAQARRGVLARSARGPGSRLGKSRDGAQR